MTRRSLLLVVLAALVLVAFVSLPRSPLSVPRVSLLFAPSKASVRVSSSVSDVRLVGGRPSLSVAFINRVLSVAGSPAVGLGQTLYDESAKTGIDDAVALGFFQHESTFGRYGVATVTNSLGNIICAGAARCVGRFRWYPSWQAGAIDWYMLLSTQYLAHGLVTLEQIVPVYAPASENNVSAYITAVRSAVLAWRTGRVVVSCC